jgi:hypothetical protein
MDDRGSIRRMRKNLYVCLHVQTGSGAHPRSYPTGTGGLCPGYEAARPWRWQLHLVPILRTHRAFLSYTQHAFMVWCLDTGTWVPLHEFIVIKLKCRPDQKRWARWTIHGNNDKFSRFAESFRTNTINSLKTGHGHFLAHPLQSPTLRVADRRNG